LAAPLAGALIGANGLGWSFGINGLLLFLALLVTRGIPFDVGKQAGSFWNGVHTMLSNPRWMLFLALVFVGGLGLASINSFLSLYMEQLGASKGLIGLALTISTISEFPVMYFGNRIMRRMGTSGILILAMCVTGSRLLLTSFAPSTSFLILLQLSHGFNSRPSGWRGWLMPMNLHLLVSTPRRRECSVAH
jgi:PPP family 3-phenylpropionic acid transporter